jgi:hypothetical protein
MQWEPWVLVKSTLKSSREASVFEFSAWLMLMIVGVGLLIPLLYALGTLRGMREKRIYPLLRLRARDGEVSSFRMTRRDAPPMTGW